MVRRPVLHWHGGKWALAPWIIGHFPPHRIYVEAFGGAASVLLRKPRCYCEVYNDLDDEVVSLFEVLRGGAVDRLIEAVRLTPYARAEFEGAQAPAAAGQPAADPVERARRLIVRSGLSPRGRGNRLPARGRPRDGGSIPAWAGKPNARPSMRSPKGVYPRVGGETVRRPRIAPGATGLSPRGRGNPRPIQDVEPADGSIPAWAGKPNARPSMRSPKGVYPRVGGETGAMLMVHEPWGGLSPRGRGNLIQND